MGRQTLADLAAQSFTVLGLVDELSRLRLEASRG